MDKQSWFSKNKFRVASLIFAGIIFFGSRIVSIINSKFDSWGIELIDKYIVSHGGDFISWILRSPLNLISAFAIGVYLIIGVEYLYRVLKNYLEKEKFLEPRVKILQEKDDVQGDYDFKEIQLRSQSHQKLTSCYAIISSFCVFDGDKKKDIKMISNELEWAKSNTGIVNNRITLSETTPVRLYIARINRKKKTAEIVTANNYYTSVSNGTYLLNVIFNGDNFLPRMFSIKFSYDGKKIIEIEDISGLSKIDMGYFGLGLGKHRMKFKPDYIDKNNMFSYFVAFVKHLLVK